MFILGLISFFQTVFLPGFILVKYLNLVEDTGRRVSDTLRMLVYGFGFSLLFNYLLVFFATLVGIYTPLLLYIVLAVEALLLGFYGYCEYWPGKGRRKKIEFNRYIDSFKNFTASNSLVFNLMFFLALAVVLVYLFYFIYFLGTVFMHWDPAVTWNRFALEWSNNQIPADTWRYPQLAPANWSISYVVMQTGEVEAFAKAIMPLFAVGVLLLFLELGLRRRCSVYLVGAVFYGVLLGYLFDPSVIVSGYVDIAVSFFAFLAFHIADGGGKNRLKNILLAVIFASAAAVTKQAGLFILAVMLAWAAAALVKYKRKAKVSGKTIGKAVLLIVLTVFIITVSWYGLKEIHIRKGLDRSEVGMVQDVHKVKDPVKRFANGIGQILSKRHPKLKVIVIAAAMLIFLGLFRRESWWPTLFVVIPYTLIWGFFFSYDARNLGFVLPFMAFSGAFGTAFVKTKLQRLKKFPSLPIPFSAIIAGVLAVLVILSFTVLDSGALLRHQKAQKMKHGEPEVNRLLYEYHQNEGITGNIATNYLYLKRLPDLKQFFTRKPGRITMDFMDTLESEEGKHIHYLLMPVILKHEKEVYQRYREKLKTGQWRLIFKSGGYRFVKIRRNEGMKERRKEGK
jgi:hypothetical protein